MRFKEKTKDSQMIIRAKTSFGETVDDKALDTFARANMRGFMKAKVVRNNVVDYTGPVGISLAERLKKLITKHDFFFLLEHSIVAFQRVEMKRLSMNNVLLDLNHVYINENTKEVQFMYVPSSKPKLNNDPLSFLESIIYSANPAPERDMEYISRTIHFLRAMRGFDLAKLEKFVAREDKSVVTTIKKLNLGDSDFITSKQRDYLEHYDNRQKNLASEDTALLEDDDATGLLDDDNDATGLLCEDDENTGLLSNDFSYSSHEEEDTGLLSCPDADYYEDDGGTTLLADKEPVYHNQSYARFPTLYRVQTGETISVNKPVFRLGKERSYVDYFVTNNTAVSRSHADIVSRGNRYFVVDLNSKNRTYINDAPLQVRCETEIRDGDNLRLGNEEFIFRK